MLTSYHDSFQQRQGRGQGQQGDGQEVGHPLLWPPARSPSAQTQRWAPRRHCVTLEPKTPAARLSCKGLEVAEDALLGQT